MMKILTLTEYWASLMANGFKRVETRSWGTDYRGPILNHAAKGFPREVRQMITREPFKSKLAECLPPILNSSDVLPGRVLSRHDLVDVVPTRWLVESDEAAAKDYRYDLGLGSIAAGGTRQFEIEFGDYSDGRWAWITRNLRRAAKPFPFKGALGLRDFPLDVLREHAPELLP
jgi:hypothetical protein